MPTYHWKGLDLAGAATQGTLFARSIPDLERHLLKKNIGLMHARRSLFERKMSLPERCALFSQLGSLLSAHIPLYHALTIIATTTPKFKLLISDCAALVAEGVLLSEALSMHGIADEPASTMIQVGERTGDLADMTTQLAQHLTVMNAFKHKVSAAMRGPLLTFFFFIAVMMSIFIGVVPRFETYFSTFHAELPRVTRVILAISFFLRSVYVLIVLILVVVVGFMLSLVSKMQQCREFFSFIPFIIPGYASFYKVVHQARLYATLGILTKKGIGIAQALQLVTATTQNIVAKKEIARIARHIESGMPLSKAIGMSIYAHEEITALLIIGESTGSLPAMLMHCAQMSQKKVYTMLDRWITMLNPLMIVILGCLIACLIFALYMPLMSLAIIVN